MSGEHGAAIEAAARNQLSHHEQMLDAQKQCVPCKLCREKAVITDAGEGAGYYIRCGGVRAFKSSLGCMITERRLGGWAYNVMDWWNRLHTTALPADLPDTTGQVTEAMVEAGARAIWMTGQTFAQLDDDPRGWGDLPEYAQDYHRDSARCGYLAMRAAATSSGGA